MTSRRPLSVDLDAAAFEDDALAGVVRRGSSRRSPVSLRDDGADHGVLLPVGILRPAVERPVQQHDVARVVENAGRRRVAKPDAIGRDLVQANADRGGTPCASSAARASSMTLAVVAEDFDRAREPASTRTISA